MTIRQFIQFCAVLLVGACGASAADPDPFSFVVFGDNQCATNSATSGVSERRAVPAVIADLAPAFILHTGDIMDHGYEPEAYERFVDYYSGMLETAPFFPTLGNHDAGRGGVLKYRAFLEEQLYERNAAAFGDDYTDAFKISFGDEPTPYPQDFRSPETANYREHMPSGVTFKTFYAFQFRNVYVISCEQGTRWWTNTPRPWLEKHLKKAHQDPDIDHIIVTMHHPMYSSTMLESPPNPQKPGSGECIAPVRAHYEDLFRQYDVTMVFSGHAHLYDRFYVPDDDAPTRSEPPAPHFPHDGSGIHYIVTGGGGGPLNRGNWVKDRSYSFFQTRECCYHVTRVQIDGEALTVSAIRIAGNADQQTTEVFDQFRIAPSAPSVK